MAFNFTAVIHSMDKAVNDLNVKHDQLNSTLKNLQTELDSELPGWVGEASTAYHALQTRWNDDQAKMNAALHNLAVTLKNARDHYVQTEHGAKQAMTPKS